MINTKIQVDNVEDYKLIDKKNELILDISHEKKLSKYIYKICKNLILKDNSQKINILK